MSSSNSARHSMPRQRTYNVPESDIVIPFKLGEDADYFAEWWIIAGFEQFGEWLDERRPS